MKKKQGLALGKGLEIKTKRYESNENKSKTIKTEQAEQAGKSDDRSGCNYGCLFCGVGFNRNGIMKLIDIPEIDETGTYYILTDEIEPETGDNVEAEFFVDIVTRWSTSTYYDMPPESRMTYVFVKVKCYGDDMTAEERSELEEQLQKHIYDRYEEYY